MDDLHFLVVKVLTLHHRLALDDSMDVGGEDVAQLAQTLPVVGGFQFFFLDGQLPGQPGAQVLDGFAHRLALLTHGILPVPDGVVHIQQSAKGFRPLACPILADGAEGKLLGGAIGLGVVVGSGVVQVLSEKQRQFISYGVHIQRINSGIGGAGGEQGRLPAHQRGQAAQGVHQPVSQHVRSRLGQ